MKTKVVLNVGLAAILLLPLVGKAQEQKLTDDEKELLVIKAPVGSTIKLDSKDNIWENELLVELAPNHSTVALPPSKNIWETELLETLAKGRGLAVKIDLSSGDDHASKKKDCDPDDE